jgi:hypothetical protein
MTARSCKNSTYTWLLGPYDDMAPLFDDYLRSAYLEQLTCASHVDLSTWMAHMCEGVIIFWEVIIACLDHSLVRGSWLKDVGGPWTLVDSSFPLLMDGGDVFEGYTFSLSL